MYLPYYYNFRQLEGNAAFCASSVVIGLAKVHPLNAYRFYCNYCKNKYHIFLQNLVGRSVD